MLKTLYACLLAVLLVYSSKSSAQVNLNNGLVAYYPFNGSFNDASGNGNNGTPINGTSFGTDQWGNPNSAAFFDGINDYISVPASPSITPGRKFSLAFRFKSASTSLQILFAKSDFTGTSAPGNFQYQIGINAASVLPSNNLFFATNHTNTCTTLSSLASNYTYGTATAANTWYCVVLTFDSGIKKTYMNGVLVNTTTVSGTSNNTSIDSCASGTLRLGAWWQNDPRWFSGLMDEVRVWNRAINTQEIDSVCNLVTGAAVIPNKYAAVLGRLPCSNVFTVDTVTGFGAGDTVLVVQMKGAAIDTSNSASFGTILNYNGAGNYEFNVVKSVAGNNITLQYNVHKTFDIPNGRVQLVRVPYYQNYAVNSMHTCLPWNGRKGGIMVLNASGTITLNAPIDVSKRGFRTGSLQYVSNAPCAQTAYYYAAGANPLGAEKGEGIAEVSTNRDHGRGALANGGGGGNSSNGGGGGGSNAGAGGIGGKETAIALCSPAQAVGGLGGVALTYSNTVNRIFMGGGSGAGNANNNDGGNGGNGGGIVLLLANQLVGNNNLINANGGAGVGCVGDCWDGQPGGGGGGTILLNVASYASNVQTNAVGGDGGSFGNSNATNGPNGPGGGGGGGAVWVKSASTPSQVIPNVAGGSKGYFNATNAWGTADGSSGLVLTSLLVSAINPVDTFLANNMLLGFADSATACASRVFNNTTTAAVGVRTWSWSFGDGGTSGLRSPLHAYFLQGNYTVKLIAVDSNGCSDSLSRSIAVFCTDTVINQYAAVLSQGVCNNIYTVDTATGFTTGDTILVIQMKGAVIDSSNSSSFGSVPAYNNAGFYEYNVIQSVSGNNITLRYATLHNYNIPNGKLQFIKTPSFNNYNATRGLSCMPWTGSKGGVLAIRVAGTLTLNADVDVSGKGFRGGQPLYKNQQPCNKTDYFYSAANNEGGQKGEGITEVSAARLYGRGPRANGGGGGNGAKSGGGGGGHYAAGGAGGNQSITGACATTPNIGGVGGTALNSSPFSRAFLGGGGGSGQGNDTAEKAGGNGGGIIFINAATIAGNNHALRANGSNAPECSGAGVIGGGCANDGGGGGGAGGLIYSTASSITGNLSVQAAGGKGSNVYMIGDPQVGPGGGGGGGAWAFVSGSVGSGVVFTGTGGAAGVLPQFGSTSYGAQPGSNGQTYSSSAMPQANVLFNGNVINVAFSDSAISCFGRQMINKSVSISAVPITSNWYFPASATSNQLNPAYTFPGYGSYLVTLTIVDSNGCSSSLAKYVNIPYVHFAQGSGDTTVCDAKPVFLSATGGVSYVWTPAGSITSPTAAGTLANPAITTIYMVTVTDSKGCIDSAFVTVRVSPGKSVEAFPSDTSACSGSKVQLLAKGASIYQWTPVEGLNNPNISTPVAVLNGDATYVVFATDSAGCMSADTVSIHQRPNPEVQASAEGIGSKCEDKSVLLKATGTANSYSWSPASHVSNGTSNMTSAKPPVTTLYTVTGKDAFGCAGTDTVTAFVNDDALVVMPDAFSPNGDSRNDMMHPMIFCDFTLDEYRIYDRWGREVFVSNSISTGWNGRRNGEPADVGTYHYIITGRRTSNSQKIMTKGTFILMR